MQEVLSVAVELIDQDLDEVAGGVNNVSFEFENSNVGIGQINFGESENNLNIGVGRVNIDF
jgi:hypothetical protein